MVKPELGTKRVCVSCSARFYDLMKSPAVCPKCGTEQPVEQPRVRRASGNLAEEKRLKKPPAPAEDSENEVEETEEGAEEEDDATDSTDALDDDADADVIPDEIEIEPEES